MGSAKRMMLVFQFVYLVNEFLSMNYIVVFTTCKFLLGNIFGFFPAVGFYFQPINLMLNAYIVD